MVITAEINGAGSAKKEFSDKENIWSAILSDVQTRGSTKLPSCKQILVLGDNESGKTTLVAKLQGVEDPKKGSGLEYAYIDVRDEYRDDHTRLSVWVLDGDPGHGNLLRYALNERTFEHTLVVLTVSMTVPWGLLEQLQHWAAVLADHVDHLNLDTDTRQRRRQHLVRAWRRYVEPGDDPTAGGVAVPLDTSSTSPVKRASSPSPLLDESTTELDADEGAATTPLPDGALQNNLGLDIVVVVTKTDYMATLEKEHDFRDEHLDFMQQWIRRFCLQYGAALFYTSAKEDKNCDLLYKYLTHRIYGLPFRTPALVVEKDAVFVPAGWDNNKKISILHENMHGCRPDDYYRDVIAAPAGALTSGGGGASSARDAAPAAQRAAARDPELLAEDEQTFLARQQQVLLAGGAAGGGGGGLTGAGRTSAPGGGLANSADSPLRSPASSLGKASPRASLPPHAALAAAAASASSPKKLDSAKVVGAPGGEGVLANFFNSLLHKKSGAAGAVTTGSPAPAASPRTSAASAPPPDAAAELDRLAKTNKPPAIDLNSSDC